MDDDNKDCNSSLENESTECHFERGTHSVNITGQGYDPRKSLHDSHTMNGSATNLNNGNNNNNTSSCSSTSTPLPVQTFSSFRDHIKSKASLAETFMKNLSRNNNNVSNNNYNHLPNSNSIGEALNKDTYNILQSNSKKLMDSARKQHKYLAKRKILMHYSDELNEKRLKELERYGMEHDANNNSNQEMNINETVPQHNNFKIRLMENHLKANQEQQERQQQQLKQRINKNHLENDEDEEEEALNLVQNNTHDYDNKNETKMIHEPSDVLEIVEHEPTDMMDQTSESDVASINNGSQLRDEDDINNNNTTTSKKETMEIDSNNNTNMKNIALINAINKKHDNHSSITATTTTTTTSTSSNTSNATMTQEGAQCQNMEHSDQETAQHHPHHHPHSHHHHLHHHTQVERHDGDSEDDINNNDSNNNNNNNNHHHQLDLSTVKSIATAEILCGLKSKVFKMEKLDTRDSPAETQCRSLNEIKQAE